MFRDLDIINHSYLCIYILGLMAAVCFRYVPADILTLLASKQSHIITRVCAAVFGVSIIGLGAY